MHPKKFMFSNTEDHGKLYLYKYGDECVKVTGGLQVTIQNNCTITKNSDNLEWRPSSGTMQYACIHSVNLIDWTKLGYKTIHLDFEDHITVTNVSYINISASKTRDTRPYNDGSSIHTEIGFARNGIGTPQIDRTFDFNATDHSLTARNNTNLSNGIANLGLEPRYFGIWHYSDYSQTGYAKIYAIWLE